MNYQQTVEYIHSLGFFSLPPTLERIKKVMAVLGNPQNNFKSVHIAGTNGKGSVCAMISESLKAAGYRVGTFVSPYIVNFRERIQINGEYIRESDLVRLAKTVKDTNIALTEFEFITAMGFLYFSERRVDFAVVETGLGGRLDATNIITPEISVITKIGFDHTAILGDTIEKIAKEKCGIIKGDSVVTSHTQPSDAMHVINECAKTVITPDISAFKILSVSVEGNTFNYKGAEYKTRLSGEYQLENALIAIEALKNARLNVSHDDIKTGLGRAFMPARFEIVSKAPLIVLDGAHNPDGAAALSGVMKNHSKITAIIGVMKDKNYEEVLKLTLPLCENVVCVSLPQNPRALSADELAVTAQKYCKNVFTAQDLRSALQLAKKRSGENPIFIFGSLYLASAIRPILQNYDN